MRPETFVAIHITRMAHHRVDRIDHSQAVPAGVVAGQQIALQGFLHKRLRSDENLRLGAAKPINALLRVTD